jgi:phosphate-selective porin OprO/OprP
MRYKSLLGGAALGVMAAAALSSAAQAQDLSVRWRGAPEFSNDDVKFKVRGRVYMDYVAQEVDRDTGVDVSSRNSRTRTARLGVEGNWNTQFAYKAEFTLSGGSTQWEDLILEYKPNETTSVMIGNFKTIALENITSSRYTTFMERGAFADFIDGGRVMNVGVKVNGETWTAGAFLSGDSINESDVSGEETFGANARVTFAPVMTDTMQVHLGGWARYRERGDDSVFRYRVRNNTNVGDRFTDSGATTYGSGESDTMFGLEAALVRGPFSLQGEYALAEIERQAGEDVSADAFYVYGSWFPTGETRNYEVKKGEFGRTRILNPITAGGPGAWELGLRYDAVDLTEFRGLGGAAIATAGEYTGVTAGVNWYPFPYVRFMANYTKAENDAQVSTSDVDVDTLQLRAQFDF